MSEAFEVTMKGYALETKEVKKSTTSGVVYLPKEWVGKKVRVVLLDDLEI